MKKLLIGLISGLVIIAIPMIGAYVFYNGSEWVRAADGCHLIFSCICLAVTILGTTIYYFDRDI